MSHKLYAMAVLSISAAAASAHEDASMPTGVDRIMLEGGFGLYSLNADRAYPAPRLPGVLESGSARADERMNGFDYAELGAKIKLNEGIYAKLKGARHGGTAPMSEVEEAWLSAERPVGERGLRGQLGRQLIPLGLQNQQHSHTWKFGIAPLAMRAAINDSWRADGLQLNTVEQSGYGFGAGMWHNEAFPGAPATGINLAHLRLGWKSRQMQLELGYAYAATGSGRPLVTLGSMGHTHILPSCDTVTAIRVCFNGHADVVAAAGQWTLSESWWLGGEWWFKRDSGRLDSLFGTPDYVGTLNGGWLDVGWKPHPQWEVVLRTERIAASHRLVGANVSVIAAQAGISDSSRPLASNGLALCWQLADGHRVSLEYHREEVETQPNAATLLRYQYSFSH
ncbi:MAG: hypothetical protein HY016_07675 [Nitrosomonadales bacterium]|nr:hypothetical protein [Nitrosomonadales bacterium]